MKVKFENVEAGWMTVTLLTESDRYTFEPSDLPCDSIRELVDGLGNLLARDDSITTHWNDEPIEHEFVFEKTDDQLQFTVYRLSQRHTEQCREAVFSAKDSTYKIIRSFWVALRDLEARYFGEENNERWSNPFPKLEMQFLTKQLAKLKNTLP